MFAVALESANKIGVQVDKFVGNLKALGATFLEEGDIIRVPEDFKVWKNTQLTTDDSKPVCFTLVEILKGDEVVGGKQVYPGAFNRTVYHYTKDEDGSIINMHKTFVPKGRPVDDFNTETNIQDAFKKIAGRKIKVSKAEPVETRNFERTDTTTQQVYTFEYVN